MGAGISWRDYMIKIIISQGIYNLLQEKESLLKRQDVVVFPTASNDEILKIHFAEQADLIISDLDLPGMASELLYSTIRKNTELQRVAVIMICPNNIKSIERCSRCMADAAIPHPVNPALIMAKAQHLLNLSLRETSRVPISIKGEASVHGNPVDTALICCTHDISSTGVLLETEEILTRGDQIVCSFFLPDGTRFQASGEIVRTVYPALRSAASQYGIRFLNLTEEARQALEKFIKNFEPLQ
jgi:CheY-like chemotaxis protein